MDRRRHLSSLIQNANFSRHSGQVSIELAGLRLNLFTDSGRLEERLREYFSQSLSTPAPIPDGEISLQLLPPSAEHAGLWDDVDPEFDIQDSVVVQRDFVARRVNSLPSTQAAAYLAPELDDAIHNCLRWFVPRILLRNGGFLLHGAGAVKEGKGYVFFGQSEAGKSTSVRLISEKDPAARIVGDDAVIIRMHQEEAWLYSAPLGCGYSRLAPPNLCAPLVGMYSLKQDRAHSVETLTASEGVSALLASAMNESNSCDLDTRFELAIRFAKSSAGIHRLHFKKDAGFWDLLQENDNPSVYRRTNVTEQPNRL